MASSPALAPVLTRDALNPAPATPAARSTTPSQSDFLKLLVTQMQNQDPLNPINNSDMMTQLAQLSTVDGMTQLNKSMSDMLTLQQLTQGANLVGKTVTYNKTDGSVPGRGVVKSVQVNSGTLQLQMNNGRSVTLSQITSIAAS